MQITPSAVGTRRKASCKARVIRAETNFEGKLDETSRKIKSSFVAAGSDEDVSHRDQKRWEGGKASRSQKLRRLVLQRSDIQAVNFSNLTRKIFIKEHVEFFHSRTFHSRQRTVSSRFE